MTRARTVLLPPVLAVLFAALLCAVALLISGDNPFTVVSHPGDRPVTGSGRPAGTGPDTAGRRAGADGAA